MANEEDRVYLGYNSAGHPQFDLTVDTKAEAQKIGRQSVVVAIKEGGWE